MAADDEGAGKSATADLPPGSPEYKAAWHQANKDRRNPAIHERKANSVARVRAEVHALLVAYGGCATCGATEGLGVRLRESEGGGRTLSQLTNSGWTMARLRPIIEAAAVRGDIACAACLSRADKEARRASRGDEPGVTKFCTGCEQLLPVADFGKPLPKTGRLQNHCVKCRSEEQRRRNAARK